MKVLVTGASGFIGKNFLRKILSKKGCKAVSIGIEPSREPGVVDFVVGDLASSEACETMKKIAPDVLIHLAGAGVSPSDRDIPRLLAVNAMLPPQIVRHARQAGIKAIIMAGSCSEYRQAMTCTPITEDDPLEESKLYGTTKAAGGLLACAVGSELSIPVAALRIFNVYGPNEAPHRLTTSLLNGLRSKTRVSLSPGTQVRDFIFVDDVCEGFFRAADLLASGDMEPGVYNLATGVGTTIRDFSLQFARSLNVSESLLGFGDLPLRKDETMCIIGNSSKLAEQLDWKPAISVDEGIGLIVEGICKNG